MLRVYRKGTFYVMSKCIGIKEQKLRDTLFNIHRPYRDLNYVSESVWYICLLLNISLNFPTLSP